MAAKRSLTLRCRLVLSLRHRSPEVSDCSSANRKRKLGFDRQETDLFTLLILLDSRGQVCGAFWPDLVQSICIPPFSWVISGGGVAIITCLIHRSLGLTPSMYRYTRPLETWFQPWDQFRIPHLPKFILAWTRSAINVSL